jgi:transposase
VIVDALKAECPGYAVMRPLMLGFRSLLRQPTTPCEKVRAADALHQWLDRAHATGIGLIQNFVCLLRRDILAVEAAVTTRWSNGPVEGQVNRLRMLKRQMYGRARRGTPPRATDSAASRPAARATNVRQIPKSEGEPL